MERTEIKKCCDNCIYYKWYYDKCTKFDCEVDARSVCSEFVAFESGRKNNDCNKY